jgi:uncharacterized protein (TIGR03000 family)
MFSQGSSLRRLAVWTSAALVLGLVGERSARAQTQVPLNPLGGYREPGPIVPEDLAPRISRPSAMGGTGTTTPVLTPGYFEVVCPAICYGGAFHVCGIRAFGGAGYYGPFRRYWGYSTYGPNVNIGPDNSIQFGLQSGVIYEATRLCKGLRKHGGDPGAYAGFAPQQQTSGGNALPAGGSGASAPDSMAPGATPRPAGEPTQRSVENLPPPTDNAAHLRLLVPENAEVLVEGRKTTTTGSVREFVSPPLQPGKNMIYSVLVRYTDDGGKPIEETHSIRVRANDRLSIDCTKPSGPAIAVSDASQTRR